jgi:hypothetical protein
VRADSTSSAGRELRPPEHVEPVPECRDIGLCFRVGLAPATPHGADRVAGFHHGGAGAGGGVGAAGDRRGRIIGIAALDRHLGEGDPEPLRRHLPDDRVGACAQLVRRDLRRALPSASSRTRAAAAPTWVG